MEPEKISFDADSVLIDGLPPDNPKEQQLIEAARTLEEEVSRIYEPFVESDVNPSAIKDDHIVLNGLRRIVKEGWDGGPLYGEALRAIRTYKQHAIRRAILDYSIEYGRKDEYEERILPMIWHVETTTGLTGNSEENPRLSTLHSVYLSLQNPLSYFMAETQEKRDEIKDETKLKRLSDDFFVPRMWKTGPFEYEDTYLDYMELGLVAVPGSRRIRRYEPMPPYSSVDIQQLTLGKELIEAIGDPIIKRFKRVY